MYYDGIKEKSKTILTELPILTQQLRPRTLDPVTRARYPIVRLPSVGAASGGGLCLFFLFSLKNVCRVFFLHSAKCLPSARQKTLGKECLPINLCRVLVAECNTRQRVCRVFVWLCRVPLTLGKPPVSRSVYFIYFFVPGSQAK